MLGKHVYFVEDIAGDEEFLRSGMLVAVAPAASYKLGKLGLPYSILEDFYREDAILADEDRIFLEQIEKFKALDTVFESASPSYARTKMRPFFPHYYRMKALTDSVILFSRIFVSILNSNLITKVTYVASKNISKLHPPQLYAPYADAAGLLPALFAAAAAQNKIDCSLVYLNESDSSDIKKLFWDTSGLFHHAKNTLKTLRFKPVYSFFKFRKFRRFFKKNNSDLHLRVLMLHAGCISMDELIRELIADGHHVFIEEAGTIKDISGFCEITKAVVPKTEEPSQQVKESANRVLDHLSSHFIPWLNSKCDLDVKRIVMPYWEDLVRNVVSSDIPKYKFYEDFYKKEAIDFVVARASTDIESVVPLSAESPHTKKACFQHGCGAFHYKSCYVSELAFFDHYFSMNDDAAAYMNGVKKLFPEFQCEVHAAPYQLQDIRKRWRKARRDENLVLYIPAKFFLGLRLLNGFCYPMTWYYEFQKRLLDYMGKRRDKKFIFKYAIGQDWSKDAVLPYIKDNGYTNIIVETRPVADCLGKVGKVLLDYPSTSFFEAAAAGIPVLSLYHERLQMRPESLDFFGRSLRKISTFKEAIESVNEFLSAEAKDYKVEIPMKNVNAVAILEQIKRRNA